VDLLLLVQLALLLALLAALLAALAELFAALLALLFGRVNLGALLGREQVKRLCAGLLARGAQLFAELLGAGLLFVGERAALTAGLHELAQLRALGLRFLPVALAEGAHLFALCVRQVEVTEGVACLPAGAAAHGPAAEATLGAGAVLRAGLRRRRLLREDGRGGGEAE